MCSAASPDGPCCSPACLRDASRERDRNLRRLRALPPTTEADALRSELSRRNGVLTGALMSSIHSLRPVVSLDDETARA